MRSSGSSHVNWPRIRRPIRDGSEQEADDDGDDDDKSDKVDEAVHWLSFGYVL